MFNAIIVAALLTSAFAYITLERRARKLHHENLKLWQRVNRMANEIANLNGAVAALDTNITKVEAKVADLRTKVADLEARDIIDPALVQTAADNVIALNGRLGALAAST